VTRPTRYRAVLAYVGTHFSGWQIQKNAPRTVQAVLEESLALLSGEPVRAIAAGRTDAGVHANGQVIHFDLARPIDPLHVREGVNALLPWDVKVLSVTTAAADFHARRDAAWKEYLYRWSRAPVLHPRDALFAAPIATRADAERMRKAVRGLPGRRDFSVFGVKRRALESGVRVLRAVTIEESGEEIRALFRGDGFLRGMVRAICGVLADIARGKAPVDRVEKLLENGDRDLLAPKAPARGLTLVRVHYEGDAATRGGGDAGKD
jgi:tRNA pseudouridine38-40 synthase